MAETTEECAMSVDSGIASGSASENRSDTMSVSSTTSTSTLVGPENPGTSNAQGPMTFNEMAPQQYGNMAPADSGYSGSHNPQQSVSTDSGYSGSRFMYQANPRDLPSVPVDPVTRTAQWVERESFDIFVQDFNGKSHTIKVDAQEKVEDLEQRVSNTVRVDQSQHYLSYQGKPMEKGKTLAECNIKKHATVQCMGRLRGGGSDIFDVYVKDFQGHSHAIAVTEEEKVETFEQKVAETLKVDQSQQYLTFGGRTLEQGKRLCDYKIKKNCTVQCMGRLRGGDFNIIGEAA